MVIFIELAQQYCQHKVWFRVEFNDFYAQDKLIINTLRYFAAKGRS